MNTCAKCGACTTVCPVYGITGKEPHSARGKIHLLERLPASKGSRYFAEIFSKCLLCGACLAACPRRVDTPARIIEARSQIPRSSDQHPLLKYTVRKTLAHHGLLSGLTGLGKFAGRSLADLLPADSGLRLKLGLFSPDSPDLAVRGNYLHSISGRERKGADLSFFVGCYANYLQPRIGSATEKLLALSGMEPPHTPQDQACCGLAVLNAGGLEDARKLARKNIEAFKGDHPVLTSCASCYSHLRSYPDLFTEDPEWREEALAFSERVREFSSYFAGAATAMEKISRLKPGVQEALRVFYHDPCHLRFGAGITAPPRQLLSALPGIELVELPDGPQCCGMGGLFHLTHPDLSGAILDRLLDEILQLAAPMVVSTCSGCLLHIRQGMLAHKRATQVRHLGVFLADLLR